MKKYLSFKNVRLYCIIDPNTCKKFPLTKLVKLIISGGADALQLRDKISTTKIFLKEALTIKKISSKENVPFVINNRADIARLVNADGLHIGQDDLPIRLARRIIGKNKIIGVSCHNLKQAIKAWKDGADYISFGPIFDTPFKIGLRPKGISLLRKVVKEVKIPVFAIGGINQDNIQKITDCNINKIAVIRAIFKNKDIEKTTRDLKFKLE